MTFQSRLVSSREPRGSVCCLLSRTNSRVLISALLAAILYSSLTIQGSLIAPRYIQREMLEFAAFHKIQPILELFPMTEDGIKEALEKLERGEMRFRAVLKPE